MHELLERQADRIEMVLAQYQAPGRIAGGVVTPRWVQFHLNPALGTRLSRVEHLADEIALALGAPYVRVSRQGATMQIDVPRSDPQPVKLLDLCRRLPAVPLGTAVLGLADDGAPLLLRLPSPDVAHVLVAGADIVRERSLMQSMAISLALAHRRSQLQIAGIGNDQMYLDGLPHLIDVATDYFRAEALLTALVSTANKRTALRESRPLIVVCIGALEVLPRVAQSALNELLLHGHKSGIHIIAYTLDCHVNTHNFPIRLVGRTANAEDARAATGVSGSGAEKLAGHGDFVAVSGAGLTRFQAALIDPDEISQVVTRTRLQASGAM